MTDTPTHRTHILQVKMAQLVEWTKQLQAQRALIVERVAKIKSNSRIARSMQAQHTLRRTLERIERDLTSTEEKLNKCADNMNKCRGLVLELSDFELVLEHTEPVHGSDEASTGDRGTVSEGTDGPTDNGSAVQSSGEAACPAPADL